MARRISFAARALDYVETAPEGEVEQLLGLLNARFKSRDNRGGSVVVAGPKKQRRKRQPRSRSAAGVLDEQPVQSADN